MLHFDNKIFLRKLLKVEHIILNDLNRIILVSTADKIKNGNTHRTNVWKLIGTNYIPVFYKEDCLNIDYSKFLEKNFYALSLHTYIRSVN